MILARERLTEEVERGLAEAQVTALLGSRQCGKTTLARSVAAGRAGEFFDLERPRDPGLPAEPGDGS